MVGSAAAFIGLTAATLVWLAVGPLVDYSDAWLLVPSAIASILALLLVVLLQYSQNRDTRARTDLLRLEHLSDEELTQIETET